ncbi:autotransporter outer membrane beta-barrel domain-containing protein [Yersinia rohdei]|uniref:autotransporter outer membrane beta-barrel domain-containing protein n=1 Tax=Yersinia rohdei TaxID=29485 RepID=UPI0011A7A976|nr:autotransporter outer membrane beta-barrel domain-containing protein [Yersinia rohdei]
MKSGNTLNTRLLPLSILVSSLISGGAIAATGDVQPVTKDTMLNNLQKYLSENVINDKQLEKLNASVEDKYAKLDAKDKAQQDYDQAKSGGDQTIIDEKLQKLEDAKDEIAQLDEIAPTTDTPAFAQTIAAAKQQTVAADTMAIATNVADGAQNVAGKGIIHDSVVTENGTINLAQGAAAHNTIITSGTLNNSSGEDYGTQIGANGKLVLEGNKVLSTDGGKDTINAAKSLNAKVANGGKVIVKQYGEIQGLHSTGAVELQSGAKANQTVINGGTLTIAKDANAEYTTLENTDLTLIKGATATSTTLNDKATFTVQEEATASVTIVNGEGAKFILEKGSSASLTNMSEGMMIVHSDASINETNVVSIDNSTSSLHLKEGATATKTIIEGLGSKFIIEVGATATDTLLIFTEFELQQGATADNTSVTVGSTFTLLNGAEATGTKIDNRGIFTVNSGATAKATEINGGYFNVQTGAIAKNTVLNTGDFTLFKDATANDTTVNGGIFTLAEHAETTGTIIDGGMFDIKAGAIAKNTVLNSGDFILVKDATANDTKVNGGIFTLAEHAETTGTIIDGGKFNIQAGAIANKTDLISGTLDLVKGATANETKIGKDGVLNLAEGGVATSTTLNGGEFNIQAGAIANKTDLISGTLDLVKGATANETTIRKDGVLNLAEGSVATSTTLDGGEFNIKAGAIANKTDLISGTLDLVNGARANETTIRKDGLLNLAEGSVATSTTLDGGKFIIQVGAIANKTDLINGTLDLVKNTRANETTIRKDGALNLAEGAIATHTIIDGGVFDIKAGAIAQNTRLKSGNFQLIDGATANNTTVNGGVFTLADKAETTGTIIDGGVFDIKAGAIAQNTLLKSGNFQLIEGATANNTTVNGGVFTLADKAETTGTIIDGGAFDVQAGAAAYDTLVKKGKFNLMALAQAHKLVIESGDALIAGLLTGNTELKGGTTTFDKTANVSGSINAAENSIINLHEGATTKDSDLVLAGHMTLLSPAQIAAQTPGRAVFARSAFAGNNGQPAQFAFKDVNLAGGTIDLSKSPAKLTMASLTGNGRFNLSTNHSSAPLAVTGNAEGMFDIQLDSNGIAPTNLNVIDVAGTNKARFALVNGHVDLGNYQHTLVSDNNGGFKLVANKSAMTPSAAGALAIANTTPVIFDAELSSIQNRLDKQSVFANESGVWGTYLNNNYQVKGTATNFSQKLNGMTLGGDKTFEVGNAIFSVGGFASHSSSNMKSDYQSTGSIESNSLGAYVQYLANSGYYFNTVLKTNQFKQNLNVVSQGNNATGTTNFSGLGVAAKVGKHINIDAMYISPFVGLSSFTSGKSTQQLSNGMSVQSQGSSKTTGTIGVNSGYRFILNNGVALMPYGTFSLDSDLVNNNEIMINNENFDNGQKGSRANAGVGVNVNLTPNLSVNSEVAVSKGKNIATPMTINAGVAYSF